MSEIRYPYRTFRFEVEIDGVPHRFAGGEFSNGVFGVYLPAD